MGTDPGLGAALEVLDEAVTITDLAGRTVYANAAAVRLLQARSAQEIYTAQPGELMARFAVFDESNRPLDLADLPGSRATRGEAAPRPLLVRNVVLRTGEERWLLNKVSLLRDHDGTPTNVVNVIEDVSEVKRAELAQRLLARAADAFAGPIAQAEIPRRMSAVAVPVFADDCEVHLQFEMRPRDAEVRHGEHESTLTVGLESSGESLGEITFRRRKPMRRFVESDVVLAVLLGRRAALAVIAARLDQERNEIARILQEALLPPALPDLPGWAHATHYLAAGRVSQVGGDFYDVFQCPNHGAMLAIGDVAGQGVAAASLTALGRYTLRTMAELTGDPVQALHQLNRVLRDQPRMSLITAALIRLHAENDVPAADVAIAGHPPPLLLRGRSITQLGTTGALAGAFGDPEWVAQRITLNRGDRLVLYTDGVLDAVGHGGARFGFERLADALKQAPPGAQQAVDMVASALERFRAGSQRDDTAIVCLELTDPAAWARFESGHEVASSLSGRTER